MVQPEREPDAPPRPEHLASTAFIDADNAAVRAFAGRAVAPAGDDRERVGLLFAAVRDEIRYDPYSATPDPDDYVAGNVLTRPAAYCIPKAVLLTAASRSLGIPARLGFADVRNHLQSERLAERMGGTDLFVWHGYSELYLDGAWRKATPAFNASLCARFGVAPLEFDGSEDALLHPFTGDGSRHMEYVTDRGSYSDLPLEQIVEALEGAYPGFLNRRGDDGAEDPAFADSSPA
jgi:transglutaminase-like putative cysteine protease